MRLEATCQLLDRGFGRPAQVADLTLRDGRAGPSGWEERPAEERLALLGELADRLRTYQAGELAAGNGAADAEEPR